MNDFGIGDLLAIITVAGVAVYVLGLVGLALTMRFKVTRDLSMAWYAVSLVSRTVVTGQGIRIWLRWPIILTAVILPAAVLTRVLSEYGLFWFGPGGPGFSPLWILFVVAVFAASPAVVSFWRHEWTRGDSLGEEIRVLGEIAPRPTDPTDSTRIPNLKSVGLHYLWSSTLSVTVGSGLITVGSALIAQLIRADCLFVAAGIGNNFVVGATLVFLGGFIVGIPSAVVVDLPLPWVQITVQSDGDPPVGAAEHQNLDEASNSLRGRLVSHSDGFWHVFDKNNQLLSIPDAQVLKVRIFGKADPLPDDRLPEHGPL